MTNPSSPSSEQNVLIRRHLIWGWSALLFFLTLGGVLEALHGFKVGAYLNPSNATRRLVWTLAHAHGTLLGLVHIAFAATLPHLRQGKTRPGALASGCLRSATILLPGGFFLGGFGVFGSDPGLGIFLVPPGAIMLLLAVALTVKAVRQS